MRVTERKGHQFRMHALYLIYDALNWSGYMMSMAYKLIEVHTLGYNKHHNVLQ
jgi:hypothetical protein